MSEPIKAKDLPDRSCFRKRTGEFVYLKISESAVKFYGLKPGRIYGVAYNGNMAAVEPETLVVEMPIRGMLENLASEQAWDNTFAKNV